MCEAPYYTKVEKDAMDYSEKKNFYEKYQDPKFPPNRFENRQSFLRKIHDPILSKNFLLSNHKKIKYKMNSYKFFKFKIIILNQIVKITF